MTNDSPLPPICPSFNSNRECFYPRCIPPLYDGFSEGHYLVSLISQVTDGENFAAGAVLNGLYPEASSIHVPDLHDEILQNEKMVQ